MSSITEEPKQIYFSEIMTILAGVDTHEGIDVVLAAVTKGFPLEFYRDYWVDSVSAEQALLFFRGNLLPFHVYIYECYEYWRNGLESDEVIQLIFL